MLAPDRILALDIGASTVKVGEFQASRTHGLRLTNFNYADLGIDPEHEENRKALIVSTIRNVLREKNIRTRRVVFSVSGQSVFTRFVKLPPVDESKVVQIIQYEAQQNVPFPIDEVIWDYQLVGNTQQGELEVVLLAIKSDIIEELNEGVESAELRTETVDVAPMALYNAVRYNEGDTEGCTMVVDIGARTTNLLFLEKNRVFSRSIPIAGNAITQSVAAEFNIPFLEADQLKRSKGFVALGGAYAEPGDEQQARVSKIIRNVMTRLHAEVARSINFYRSQQGGSAPSRMLLSGGTSILPYTDRFFQEKLQIPIEYFNPFRNVDIDPSISREELARCAHFFGEVVGLGLRKLTKCPLEVNLLPRSIRARILMEQKRPYLAGAAICALLIPLCWWAYTTKTASLQQQQREDVSRQVEALQSLDNSVKNEKSKLADLTSKADEITGLVKQRSFWPELLQDLNTRLEPNLYIVALTPQSGDITPGPQSGAITPGPTPRGGGGSFRRPSIEEDIESPTLTSSATAKQGPQGPIDELQIEGEGNHQSDSADLALVNGFAKNLGESPFLVTDGVEIQRPPKTTGSTFAFQLRARLAKPIAF
ncbi:MAG: type IV pilus assembly protein PilM [Verrucomicrobiia bacterium]